MSSDSDVDAALNVLQGAAPLDGDVHEAMQVILKQPMSRAQTLEKARFGKLRKSKRIIRPEVVLRIWKHNLKATRRHELINLDGPKEKLTRSERKKWLPAAVISACFSARARPKFSQSRQAIRMRLRRGVTRKACDRRSNPHSRATSAIADAREASCSYVQEIRDAMANLIWEEQLKVAQTYVPCTHAVAEVALDETEHKVSIRKLFPLLKKVRLINLVVPVLVIHVVLFFTYGVSDPVKRLALALPMVALSSKSGACHMQALHTFLEPLFGPIRAGSSGSTLILTSDAAKANRLLFRQMLGTFPVALGIHSKCHMHQIALAICAAAGPLKVIGPVFCGAKVLHHGSTQQALANVLARHLHGQVDFTVVDTRSPEHIQYVSKLLDLLHWDESMLSAEELRRPEIAKQRLNGLIDELKMFLHGDLSKPRCIYSIYVICSYIY